MPLTAKGESIKKALVEQYGEKRGTSILYAGKNSGKFTGIDQGVEELIGAGLGVGGISLQTLAKEAGADGNKAPVSGNAR